MLCHVFWSQVEYKIVCFIYWEPEREQETSFGGGESLETKFLKQDVERLYQNLSEKY